MDALLFDADLNFHTQCQALQQQGRLDCVLIDEAQFLSKAQVKQLTDVVDLLHIPVLAFGLRTDFLGETFAGSQALLAWADKLIELKTICHCGRKANFVVRLDQNGHAATAGSQVQIGGNDRYVSMCRNHFKQLVWQSTDDPTPA
jgi:thymidine kinase